MIALLRQVKMVMANFKLLERNCLNQWRRPNIDVGAA
jgi:hypothetical protein